MNSEIVPPSMKAKKISVCTFLIPPYFQDCVGRLSVSFVSVYDIYIFPDVAFSSRIINFTFCCVILITLVMDT